MSDNHRYFTPTPLDKDSIIHVFYISSNIKLKDQGAIYVKYDRYEYGKRYPICLREFDAIEFTKYANYLLTERFAGVSLRNHISNN